MDKLRALGLKKSQFKFNAFIQIKNFFYTFIWSYYRL